MERLTECHMNELPAAAAGLLLAAAAALASNELYRTK